MARERRRRRRRSPEQEPEVVEEVQEEQEETEEEQEETASRRRGRRSRPEPEPEVEEAFDEDVEEEDEDSYDEENEEADETFSISDLLEELESGKVLNIEALGNGRYALFEGEKRTVRKSTKKVRIPGVFWDFIVSDEYKEWAEDWNEKTYEEKVEYAKKNKIAWDPHETERVDHMRVSAAVRDAEIGDKHKPVFQDSQIKKKAKQLVEDAIRSGVRINTEEDVEEVLQELL